ncbi:MAG: metallophosphoesterase [Phycisphaerales bacterium JB052]
MTNHPFTKRTTPCMLLCIGLTTLMAQAQPLRSTPHLPESPGTPGRGIASITRGPYLQMATPSSMILRWRTDVATDSRVMWGSVPGQLTESITDPALTTEHEVMLTGLNPDTRYYYSVGSSIQLLAGDDAAHHLTTSPPTGSDEPVRLWVIGDSGTGDDNARAVRDAYLQYAQPAPTDVWLTLGDNAYLLGTDSEHQLKLFDMYPSILRTTPIWPSIGNHDAFSIDQETQTGPFFDIFSLPTQGQAGGVASGTEAYYSFDYANIHFICLDTSGSDRSIDGPMLTWLAQDLQATQQRWLIAFFHHPPYSFGHNSDSEEHEPEMFQVRERVLPMLESAGVDLVLGGHSHSYERSYFLNGHYGVSSSLDASMILDSGDGQITGTGAYHKPSAGLVPNEGAVFVVAGSSGLLTGDTLGHPAMQNSRFDLGSMVIDIFPHRLDAIFLTDKGVIADHFVVTKGPQPCIADVNRDGTLNFFDVSAYIAGYTAQTPAADLDGNGTLNFFDISMFLTAFSQGCP